MVDLRKVWQLVVENKTITVALIWQTRGKVDWEAAFILSLIDLTSTLLTDFFPVHPPFSVLLIDRVRPKKFSAVRKKFVNKFTLAQPTFSCFLIDHSPRFVREYESFMA
ncbi:MAG: hypothetical protein ABIV39_03185 [Verrucomicrobiota bacterium]